MIVVAESEKLFRQLLDSPKYNNVREFLPEFPKETIDMAKKTLFYEIGLELPELSTSSLDQVEIPDKVVIEYILDHLDIFQEFIPEKTLKEMCTIGLYYGSKALNDNTSVIFVQAPYQKRRNSMLFCVKSGGVVALPLNNIYFEERTNLTVASHPQEYNQKGTYYPGMVMMHEVSHLSDDISGDLGNNTERNERVADEIASKIVDEAFKSYQASHFKDDSKYPFAWEIQGFSDKQWYPNKKGEKINLEGKTIYIISDASQITNIA